MLVALAMLFVSVAMAGTVTVSDPGQAPGKLITTADIVPFVKITLVASNVSGQVFLTVNQSSNNSCSQIDIDLFAGSMSNKFTGGSTVIGPFTVQSGQTNNIVLSARVNSVKGGTNVSFNLVSVSNSTPATMIQGPLPISGTTYIVDTNSEAMVHGVLTFVSLTYNDDESGKYYLLIMDVKADPLRTYSLEHSLDMISWEVWASNLTTSRVGNLELDCILNPTNFPDRGLFRLESQ